MGERRDAYGVLVAKQKERYCFGNPGAGRRLILKSLLKNRLGGRGLRSLAQYGGK